MRRKARVLHMYFRRAGLYDFLIRNILKAILSIAFLITGYMVLQRVVPPALLEEVAYNSNPFILLSAFFVSETTLSAIPPEFLLFWASQFDMYWVWVFFLSAISYSAGLIAHRMGGYLGHYQWVQRLLKKTSEKYAKIITKWGGLVVMLAALTPLPFSPIAVLSGSLKYPFRLYALYSLSRIVRFVLYGLAIIKFAGI